MNGENEVEKGEAPVENPQLLRPTPPVTPVHPMETDAARNRGPSSLGKLPGSCAVTLLVLFLSILILQAPARADDAVYLVFDEHSIQDQDRADLYTIVSKMSLEHWPQIARTSLGPLRAELPQLILRTFGMYAATFPKTTKALTDLIESQNSPPAPGQLLIPPLPVSANARYRYAPTLRIFEPTTQAYARSKNLAELMGICKVSPQPPDGDTCLNGSPDPGPIRPNDSRRGTHLTGLSVPYQTLLKEVQTNSTLRSLLMRSVLPVTESGFAHVALLGNPADCSPNADWLPSSPYFALLNAPTFRATLPPAQTLVGLAKTNPLRVIDWDTDTASTGHGGKVVNTIKYLLHRLSLDPLASSIVPIDLKPQNNRDALKQIVTEYQSYRTNQGFDRNILKAYMKSTTDWLNSSPTMGPTNSVDVPEFLLLALMWKYFDAAPNWVNMSFTADSKSLDVLNPTLMIGSKSYGFLAAGNDAIELSPNSIPQAGATLYPNLVNVTFGDLAGTIYGTYSGSTYSTRVTVAAPGCGFSFGSLVTQDYGSSFASPYVAATAWVGFLLSGAKYDPSTLKQQLMLGSRPIPEQLKTIDSGGIFDAALYLMRPGPHFIDAANQVVRLAAMQLRLEFADTSQQTLSLTTAGTQQALRTMTIARCGTDDCLWYRAISFPPNATTDLRRAAKLASVTGVLVKDGNEQVTITNASDFKAKVKELWF